MKTRNVDGETHFSGATEKSFECEDSIRDLATESARKERNMFSRNYSS